VREIVLEPGEVTAFLVEKGAKFMIITMGGQTSDLSFRGLSQAITREKAGFEKYRKPRMVLRLKMGAILYDANYRPTLKLVDSNTDEHDFLWPGCSKEMFRTFYGIEKEGCRDLLKRALKIGEKNNMDVVSFFMYMGENYEILPSKAKAGDYVTLKALRRVKVGVTACPDDLLANPTPNRIKIKFV
jgi:uncharacterized protein YcgI (DUF1989 family)